MDIVVEIVQLLIKPLLLLCLILLVFFFVVRPFFKYMAVGKKIKEDQELLKVYKERKEKVKQQRQDERTQGGF